MNKLVLAVQLGKTTAATAFADLLQINQFNVKVVGTTVRVYFEDQLALTEFASVMELKVISYEKGLWVRLLDDSIYPAKTVNVITENAVSPYVTVDVVDVFKTAIHLLEKHPVLDMHLNPVVSDFIALANERARGADMGRGRVEDGRDIRITYSERRRAERDRAILEERFYRDHRSLRENSRGRRPSYRNEEPEHDQHPRVDLSGRRPLSFPDRSGQRTVTERPLNPVLPFSKRGKSISEEVTRGDTALGHVGLDHFTTENVWVETVQYNGNNLGSKFVLHIDEDTMDLEFNDESITFKGLDNWLMHNVTEYGNIEFEELIIELALGNLGKEYDKDLCNIVINKPDVILELKQEAATTDDAGSDKVNLTELEPTIKLIGRDINAKTWRVNLLTDVFTATLESENVISFEKLDEYLHRNCSQYGTNEFYYRVVRKALQQMNISTEHMQLLNFIPQDGNLAVTSPTEFVMAEKLADSKEANHVETEVVHMTTTNSISKAVPDSPSTPHNITSTQWNDILVHGNAAFANTDMRKTVDARVVMGVLFLREQEVVSPIDWKVEGGYLLLNVHRIHDLSAYRKGNYVNAIMNAMELEKADIADLNYGENVIRVKLASVKLHTKVTTQYLHAYNITSDGSDNDGDTTVAEQPVKEEQSELPGLPKPVYKLTACDIVETIQELDDCVKAEVGVIEYHQFMDRQVTVKLIDDGGVKNSIIIDGMLDGDAKRKRQYVHGTTVNALGSIMSDLFVGMELEGKVWVASTRGNSIVLRNYVELTNIPETWNELPNDADYDDLVHALKG